MLLGAFMVSFVLQLIIIVLFFAEPTMPPIRLLTSGNVVISILFVHEQWLIVVVFDVSPTIPPMQM